jgi:hypothetical protein
MLYLLCYMAGNVMKKIRPKHGPEWYIQRDVTGFLRARGWWVERTHGNLYMKGFPDLYAAHPKFGQRWIDVKNPVAWEFTKAQCQKWPVWDRFKIGIWIIVAATEEEYDKLFKEPNWRDYWKPRYDEYLMDVNSLLAVLLHDENEQLSTGKRESDPDLPIQETDLGWLNELEGGKW